MCADPADWKPDPKAGRYDPENPAKHYAFELDTFQKKSVEVMEAGESVMVSAHTSAAGSTRPRVHASTRPRVHASTRLRVHATQLHVSTRHVSLVCSFALD